MPSATSPASAEPSVISVLKTLEQQMSALQKSPQPLQQPVALIGPGDASAELCAAAYQIAHHLARCGLSIVCGGRGGVMQAASHGAFDAGGMVVGLLPENDTLTANPYLTVALPTGMGEMRNALIACCSACLVAVGGGMGTLSEIALGLKLGKAVFCLQPDFELPGATVVADVDHAVTSVLTCLLNYRLKNSGADSVT